MHKTLLIALVLGAGAISASAALPKVNIKKPAVTADATGVKVTKPSMEVSKPEGPSAADKIAEAKKNAEDAVAAAKQGIEDNVTAAKDAAEAKATEATDAAAAAKDAAAAKVGEVTDAAAAAQDAAAAKIDEAKAAAEAAKTAATPTAPAKPAVEVTKPSATLSPDGIKVTKPALKLKK